MTGYAVRPDQSEYVISKGVSHYMGG